MNQKYKNKTVSGKVRLKLSTELKREIEKQAEESLRNVWCSVDYRLILRLSA